MTYVKLFLPAAAKVGDQYSIVVDAECRAEVLQGAPPLYAGIYLAELFEDGWKIRKVGANCIKVFSRADG